MRLTMMIAAFFAGVQSAPASDNQVVSVPAVTVAINLPETVLAQARNENGKIQLFIQYRVTNCRPVFETIPVTVSKLVTKMVDGKTIQVTENFTESQTVTKFVCVQEERISTVMLDSPGVSLTDLKGQKISTDEVLARLATKTPILRSQGGPPDSYHLQTTKPDTLVLVMPSPPPAPAQLMPNPVNPAVPVPAAPVLPGQPSQGTVIPPK